MDHFIFATYIIALIAVAVALYALYEVECIKENMNKKNKQVKRTPAPPVKKHSTAKGHFDGYR